MKGFRKLVLVTVILVFCEVALAGCGNEKAGKQIDTPVDASISSTTDLSENTINEDTDGKSENVITNELAFVYKENKIAISDIVDDQKIESMLGKADEIKSHTYSNDDGLNMDPLIGRTEKQYKFPGLVIKTIDGENKKFYVFSIEITDPKYSTTRNIKVEDSFEKLKDAYPEGILLGGELSDAEDDFRYEPVDYADVMNFHIKGKVIESIQMYKLLD